MFIQVNSYQIIEFISSIRENDNRKERDNNKSLSFFKPNIIDYK